jgi:predicted PurR-regulated permease PerM
MRVAERQLLFWLTALAIVVTMIAILKDILLPFVAGTVMAYSLSPLADWLEAQGVGRALSAALIVGIVSVLIALSLVFLVPLLVNQARQIAVTLPEQLERMKEIVEAFARQRLGPSFPSFQSAFERAVAELSQNWTSTAGAIVASVWSRGLALFNFLSLLLITPIVVFYLLVDWHPMLIRVDGWLPRDHALTIQRLAGEINDAVAAFIRGQGAICLVLGIVYAIGLSWAGLNYGLLIGLATGLLGFMPIVGWLLGLIMASTIALFQFWPDVMPLIKSASVLSAGLVLDTAVLSPRFVGKKIGLHPVWLIFALYVFSYLFGFVGTLVAVPVAAAIGVLARFALQSYLASSVYQGHAPAIEGGLSPGKANQ